MGLEGVGAGAMPHRPPAPYERPEAGDIQAKMLAGSVGAAAAPCRTRHAQKINLPTLANQPKTSNTSSKSKGNIVIAFSVLRGPLMAFRQAKNLMGTRGPQPSSG